MGRRVTIPPVVAENIRASLLRLPRDARGAVDFGAVEAELHTLAAGRALPARRLRGDVASLLDALDALVGAPPPPAMKVPSPPPPTARSVTLPPPAMAEPAPPPPTVRSVTLPPPAREVPAPPPPTARAETLPPPTMEVSSLRSEPPPVVLRFDEESLDAPLGDDATEPPRTELELLAEPPPFTHDEAPLTLESLPPPPPLAAPLAPLRASAPLVSPEDLIEPSIPPPRPPVDADPGEELRLSLAPLEPLAPLPIWEPSPLASVPTVRPLPHSEAPAVRIEPRAPERVEALELDLSELGGSDAPPAMPAIPPNPMPSSHWTEVISEDDIEPIEEIEVMELEDVRVARESEPLIPTPPPAAPPLRPTRPVAVPPTPPPGLRKLR